jgi:hypothetical protein
MDARHEGANTPGGPSPPPSVSYPRGAPLPNLPVYERAVCSLRRGRVCGVAGGPPRSSRWGARLAQEGGNAAGHEPGLCWSGFVPLSAGQDAVWLPDSK